MSKIFVIRLTTIFLMSFSTMIGSLHAQEISAGISGLVADANGNPIVGAMVGQRTCIPDGIDMCDPAYTDTEGRFILPVDYAALGIWAEDCQAPASMGSDGFWILGFHEAGDIGTITLDCEITPITSTIGGSIVDDAGTPIINANICAGDTCVTSGADGSYVLAVAPGTHSVSTSAVGFVSQTRAIIVGKDGVVDTNFALLPAQNETPAATDNAFTLTLIERACTDQNFRATWTGTNLATVEFALSNTSDNWTSGWLTADPATGAFTSPVDHHGFDKVVAKATFTDGSMQQVDADVSTCVTAPAPNPDPAPTQPSGSSSNSGSSSSNSVTSLPSTGSGETFGVSIQTITLVAALALVAVAIRAKVGTSKRE